MGTVRKVLRVGRGEGPKKPTRPVGRRVGNRGYAARLRDEPGNFKRSTSAKKDPYIRRQAFDAFRADPREGAPSVLPNRASKTGRRVPW
jgi:hypothetical protein